MWCEGLPDMTSKLTSHAFFETRSALCAGRSGGKLRVDREVYAGAGSN